MTNLDKYALVSYDEATYNCAHFLADFWQDLTGQDLSSALFYLCKAKNERIAKPDNLKVFKRLDAPKNPCVVLLRSPDRTHAGVYVDGMIVHLDKQCVIGQPVAVASAGFDEVRYYAVDM